MVKKSLIKLTLILNCNKTNKKLNLAKSVSPSAFKKSYKSYVHFGQSSFETIEITLVNLNQRIAVGCLDELWHNDSVTVGLA